MNLENIKYINQSTSSLSVGSFLPKDDLMYYTDNAISRNFPFGESKKDYIKFDVYNYEENLLTSSYLYSVGRDVAYTQSYYDVFNTPIEYSYSEHHSDWVILGTETKSLFLDISRELNKLPATDGNYKVYIELGRNIVGNENPSQIDQKLIIDTISATRTEIKVIPNYIRSGTGSINTDFDLFSRNQIKIKDIADNLNFQLSSPEIYKLYNTASVQDPTGSAALMFGYGFKKEVDVVYFLTDLYYGVKKGNLRSNGQFALNDVLGIYDQFKNWLYQNYETGYTFDDVRNYYYSLFLYIVDQELNRITNQRPPNYDGVVNFLQTIYYNNIFFPKIFSIEEKYATDINGYFRYYLQLPQGRFATILNKKIDESLNPIFYNKLVLKLNEPLPDDIGVGQMVWITNDFGFLPIVQNVYFYTRNQLNTIPLRGPNFLIKIEDAGNSTEALTMEELIRETGSLYNELTTKLKTKNEQVVDTTDYRYFQNFINFSSADLRLQAFKYKRDKITSLYQLISELNIKLLSNPSDVFFEQQKTEANSNIDDLEATMDGYEKFLYNNPGWYDEHSNVSIEGYSSASFYDKNNGNSLINNLPQFLVEDADSNQDYIKFVGMIGHFFDNISLFAKQYTEKNNISNSPNYGISLDVVESMLNSLGWESEISKNNLPIILSSFSKSDFDPGSELYNQARELSEKQRNEIIWRRILNSLPYIYKTKGTEASLNALISCFGVPKNIIKIKEYGGIQNTIDLTDKSLYIVEETKYEPYFSGSGEYFQLNWTGSAQSVEFSLRFDKSKTHSSGEIFRILNCSDVWVLGAIRERGEDWGSVFFSIDDGIGNIRTVRTNRAPIFDGNSYRILLRRNDLDPLFNATSSYDLYPTRYDLLINKSEDDRITYISSGSGFFSGSYNTSFGSGSYLYIGNYNQNTASLSIDPEAFFGNIDDINIWESPISNEKFQSHTLNRSSYDLGSPEEMISENLYRISFEKPIDLYIGPGLLALKNLSFRDDFPSFYAANFPQKIITPPKTEICPPDDISAYPYQFTAHDVRLTMNLPDYGSNKFRSNKINYVQQELVSNLSSETRSSVKLSELTSVDSNKLGIFFSPSEIENKEIIKFFGEYPLGDLIGDPSDVYKKSYEKFERFKKIYYDQGFGNIDYTLFMNIVRFYFDKTMFKYIKGIIPARAKLVDGILVEPNILERPKLQIKPLNKENIDQKVGEVASDRNISAKNLLSKNGHVDIKTSGISIFNDVNQVFYDSDASRYGFEVYAQNGVTYYKDKYYRVDIIDVTKKYSVFRKQVLDGNSISGDLNSEFNREIQIQSSSYETLNLIGFPTVLEYPVTASLFGPFDNIGVFYPNIYFSGKTSFNTGYLGWGTFTINYSHTIAGMITGSITETTGFYNGIINSPLAVSGTFYPNGYSAVYSGLFNLDDNGDPIFEGSVYNNTYNVNPSPSIPSPRPEFYFNFISSDKKTSIFEEFVTSGTGTLFARLNRGVNYQKQISLSYKPSNSTLLDGYFHTHYKYKKQQFSKKEINSFDNLNNPFKWKKSSQNKKTTVDSKTGLLDNTEPVISKTV